MSINKLTSTFENYFCRSPRFRYAFKIFGTYVLKVKNFLSLNRSDQINRKENTREKNYFSGTKVLEIINVENSSTLTRCFFFVSITRTHKMCICFSNGTNVKQETNPFEEEEWDEDGGEPLVDNGEPGVPVRALYDYEGAEADELSFKQGTEKLNVTYCDFYTKLCIYFFRKKSTCCKKDIPFLCTHLYRLCVSYRAIYV